MHTPNLIKNNFGYSVLQDWIEKKKKETKTPQKPNTLAMSSLFQMTHSFPKQYL